MNTTATKLPPGLTREKCRNCGAPVFMVENDHNGKRAPINVAPVPDGDVLIDHWDSGQPFFHVMEIGDSANGATRYTRHFETCLKPKRGK